MSYKITSLLGLAFCALVSGHAISEQKIVRHYGELEHIGDKAPEHHEEYAWAYPAYEFSYFVEDKHTHDIKGQEESRRGDEVKGKYWLVQPDGRKRTVTYHANKNDGFKANVEYSDPHHEHVEADHKQVVEHVDHKTEAEHIEPKHVEEHNDEHNIEHIDHKPIVVSDPIPKPQPVMEPVHEQKPHDDHEKESHRVPIPPLSIYIPRRHRTIENYHHPRGNKRHH